MVRILSFNLSNLGSYGIGGEQRRDITYISGVTLAARWKKDYRGWEWGEG